jgi:hypothetical protein
VYVLYSISCGWRFADYRSKPVLHLAANGDVGLVKYALSRGQPINSVLDGIMHIAVARRRLVRV